MLEEIGRSVRDKEGLGIELYADGADLGEMLEAYRTGLADGFTTNPTLMAKAGVRDYREIARAIIEAIRDLPISFEVVSDDCEEMERKARERASLRPNVFVKIPTSSDKGEYTLPLIGE